MRKKDKIELSIIGIFIFLLLFIVIPAAKKTRQPKNKPAKVYPLEKIPAQELFKMLEEESKNLELKRDPFTAAPIMPPEKYASGLYLNGIFWDEKTPMAIINDNVVKIGDRVGDNVVVSIKQDRVILDDGTELKLAR